MDDNFRFHVVHYNLIKVDITTSLPKLKRHFQGKHPFDVGHKKSISIVEMLLIFTLILSFQLAKSRHLTRQTLLDKAISIVLFLLAPLPHHGNVWLHIFCGILSFF